MKTAVQAAFLVILSLVLLQACSDFPGADGRYPTPSRGGWDNFRA
jgi:hypothetical protein